MDYQISVMLQASHLSSIILCANTQLPLLVCGVWVGRGSSDAVEMKQQLCTAEDQTGQTHNKDHAHGQQDMHVWQVDVGWCPLTAVVIHLPIL